mgnify:CR=1 FL=1
MFDLGNGLLLRMCFGTLKFYLQWKNRIPKIERAPYPNRGDPNYCQGLYGRESDRAFRLIFVFLHKISTMHTDDTICAISTPPGSGAIAVLRLSGPEAIAITDAIFKAASGKKLAACPANTLHFGRIVEKEKVIDEVVVSLFKKPHSYTAEDVVEISCHGSVYLQQKILQMLTEKGARLAEPGEFTRRAFMNGKMDLSQAEAVADLISSSSAASHKLAIQQMRGGFSSELAKLRDQLLQFISLIELELDFSEEDVEFADRKQLHELLETTQILMQKLARSFELGNVIKQGIPVAIVGHTNVGKSTLLNRLLQDDRAIVSEIAGTTRDVIEDSINIEGVSYRFIDTAGMRNTSDSIESMGIERTYERIRKASIVLLVIDATAPHQRIEEAMKQVKEQVGNSEKQLITLINKVDRLQEAEALRKLEEEAQKITGEQALAISAKEGGGISQLIDRLTESYNLQAISDQEVVVSNVRHYEALKQAGEAMQRAIEGLQNQLQGDLLAMDIRETLHYLGEITGQITTDEVLGNIFKNFCIGK